MIQQYFNRSIALLNILSCLQYAWKRTNAWKRTPSFRALEYMATIILLIMRFATQNQRRTSEYLLLFAMTPTLKLDYSSRDDCVFNYTTILDRCIGVAVVWMSERTVVHSRLFRNNQFHSTRADGANFDALVDRCCPREGHQGIDSSVVKRTRAATQR